MQMFCGQKVHIISIFWPLQYMQKYSINFFFDRNENRNFGYKNKVAAFTLGSVLACIRTMEIVTFGKLI